MKLIESFGIAAAIVATIGLILSALLWLLAVFQEVGAIALVLFIILVTATTVVHGVRTGRM